MRPIGLTRASFTLALAVVLAGCALTPAKLSPTHIVAEPAPPGAIPPPVQLAPVLPTPTPRPPPETYSVVVNNVRVQDLLFALARDAKVNVDIKADVTGTVTMNAVNQTLPQLLDRIADQVDMRYQLKGSDLAVMRDTPYLHIYHVDYVNLVRDAKSETRLSTQVIASTTPGATQAATTAGAGLSNSTSSIDSMSNNKFWDTLVDNVKEILRAAETPPVTQGVNRPPAAPNPATAPVAGAGQPAAAAPPSSTPAATQQPAQPGATQASAVIANPESGVLLVRATARQHARIQQFLDQVLASARREVLIEATVAEVQLNNQYQRGIDWSKLRTGSSGLQITQSSANTPAGVNTNAFVLGYALGNYNFTSAIRLLESFGTVRVLSSPKISVLNNQTALLKVVNNLVYFTIQANTTSAANAPSLTTFTTTMQTVPVGFIMSVVPQVSDSGTVLLNLRPTVSRQIGTALDPNPSLANPCGVGVSSCATPPIQNAIPVIQTREMESVLRVQSGQIAVLGGLMEDRISDTQDTVPGLNSVPGLGALFAQRNENNTKTELVIFLRATVIHNPSVGADYASYRSLLPGPDYLNTPNPAIPEDSPESPASQRSLR